MAKLFLVSWDANDVESVVDISGLDVQCTADALSGKCSPELRDLDQTIQMMTMRARFNPSRYPEIYTISCDFEIDEKELREAISSGPDHMLPLIRKNGKKIWGSPPPKPYFNGGQNRNSA